MSLGCMAQVSQPTQLQCEQRASLVSPHGKDLVLQVCKSCESHKEKLQETILVFKSGVGARISMVLQRMKVRGPNNVRHNERRWKGRGPKIRKWRQIALQGIFCKYITFEICMLFCCMCYIFCHIFHVVCVQKEFVIHFPTHKKIARAREIGNISYLEKLTNWCHPNSKVKSHVEVSAFQ